ncbi:hypothetical protein PCCS19_13690 [Paenibacillus sp. CCS19]|uniref:hypothetical protein n=1 Tax=Paenibacillus sp. CCS19 TaxID=3158387 RepID=UPI002561BEDF|nr:hypothetical protein [Paenibacillus cellulosilyticus]GMK38315.1 hypothetical protein PCCS19_13690 [Paenibacillus cellulosilyticus]
MNGRRTLLYRLGLLSIVIVILSSLIGCSDSDINNVKPEVKPLPDAETIFLETASALREVAWNHLSEKEKATVTGDWHEAQVTIAHWSQVPLKTTKVEPEADAIYKVTFNTELDALLGPIGIYFDPATQTIVGYDVRE